MLKENWLILQCVMYYLFNQFDKVVEVFECLVKFYNKLEYWVQLGGMYGEMGVEKK